MSAHLRAKCGRIHDELTGDTVVPRLQSCGPCVVLLVPPPISSPDALCSRLWISSISRRMSSQLDELSVGPHVAWTDRERVARQAHLQQPEADFEPVRFDAASARTFGRMAASLGRAGRKPTARAYDALIAATAIANELPLYTCNPSDFVGIDELEVVAVPHLDHH